ncbi:MAG: sugar phosphate isomerase/epimerase [bacterium]|nr:sugar phosphate isomerase/epimerase [bacterium]
MKLAGHTMGVPKMDIFQAMDFFQEIGYEGIEIRCDHDGHIDPENYAASTGENIQEKAKENRMEIVCLTSYYLDLVREEVRDDMLKGYQNVIRIAHELGCKRVRYKGILPPEGYTYEEAWERTKSGLKKAAAFARDLDVWICVENHGGSMTQGAEETLKMVEEIHMDNVGVIFDYAFIDLFGVEDIDESVDILRPFIQHVHLKDHIITNRKTGTLIKLPLGEGNIDLKRLLAKLKSIGYEGFLTDEYEKYWQEDLPEPEIGMRNNARYLQKLLSEI